MGQHVTVKTVQTVLGMRFFQDYRQPQRVHHTVCHTSCCNYLSLLMPPKWGLFIGISLLPTVVVAAHDYRAMTLPITWTGLPGNRLACRKEVPKVKNSVPATIGESTGSKSVQDPQLTLWTHSLINLLNTIKHIYSSSWLRRSLIPLTNAGEKRWLKCNFLAVNLGHHERILVRMFMEYGNQSFHLGLY